MYDYPHYKEHDLQEVIRFMHRHPFVTLIGRKPNGRIEATQIPVLIEEKDGNILITGHMARKSEHHRAFEENPEALMLFTGPHAYVSGSWYAGNPQQASTWNYITVHARGQLQFRDENFLTELLRKLSLHFENYNPASSTVYDNLPADYLEKLKKAIVAFEMEVTELDNVYKLSQNRDEMSYDNIVSELKNRDGNARTIGEIMEKRKQKVFPGAKR